ncbi:DNA-processing protein DprA [Bdellovibrio bacteriovorus]|uniref:DNA-processing protein DprA n=1 Tax=Bdellovibrio bacteriovorus TaxID=959 RepID=UPI0035A5E102
MNDLYSLSQLIKNHPLYTVHRDAIHQLYLRLGRAQELTADVLLCELKELLPELCDALQKNHALFKKHCEESLKLKMQGIQLVVYGEDLFPAACYWMSEPPLTLSYWGSPAWLTQRTLAVVGSREPCFDSIQWMEKEFTTFCDQEKPCVVSGGARGVDQKSHSIALRKSASTVIVLPSGLGQLYPESLYEWKDSVLNGGGCFLSEYVFEQRMHKHLFHHRNRLIAALGKATLLVEAKRRSGTLITAQQALQLGRSLWVVPGHPQDPHFLGSLDLLAEGAGLVRDAQDLSMYFRAELSGENMSPVGIADLSKISH